MVENKIPGSSGAPGGKTGKSEKSAEKAPEGPLPELTEADINNAISEADPDFLKFLDEVYNETSLSISHFILPEGKQVLKSEIADWASSRGLKKVIYRVFPLAPHLSFVFKKVKILILDFLRAGWVRIKNFMFFLVTTGRVKVFGTIVNFLSEKSEQISEAERNFRYLSLKLKSVFFGILILMAGTGFFIYRSWTYGVIPISSGPFLLSLDRVATKVYEFNPKTDVEPFYENLRVASSIIQLPKMVVNLRKSAHSRDNPMGAFEFYLEGMVPEVTIEIKDREVEIRDRIQRVIEDFTFDQVESPEGKQQMTDKIKKELNLQMISGKIKKIWIKTVIVKP